MTSTGTDTSSDASRANAHRPRRGIPKFRWFIAGLLFLAAVLNYIDRQTLALLKPTILADLKLTEDDYALVNKLFLAAYTLAYLVSGRLVDLWGPRLSMVVFIGWWSVSNMMTAFARSVASLGCFRFMLGLGEAGNWPASTRVVSEWFPIKERAAAIGVYTMGATLGATIAPFLVLQLGHFGWQAAFVCTGAMGLVWVPLWLWMYRRPEEHRWITENDLATLKSEAAAGSPSEAEPKKVSEWRRWLNALSVRDVWLLMLARMLTDPVWYFYQQWFPSYLNSERGVSQAGLSVTWVVYLAADVGTLAGGFASAMLLRRMKGAAKARLAVMLLCALMMSLSPLVSRVTSLNLTLVMASLVVLAHLAWLANISALVVDLVPRHLLATCFGIAAAGSAIGGILMNDFVAGFAKRHDYATWFLAMSLLHPVAWLILWAFRSRGADEVNPPASTC